MSPPVQDEFYPQSEADEAIPALADQDEETDEEGSSMPPVLTPSIYGLFGWQPKPFNTDQQHHLSMNIWDFSPKTSQLHPPGYPQQDQQETPYPPFQ